MNAILFILNILTTHCNGIINNHTSNIHPTNSSPKTETLILEYNAIACTCAQWSETKYSNKPDSKIYYWLEPDNNFLIMADSLFDGNNLPIRIKVTGKISKEHGFPDGMNYAKVSKKEAGKVFRYSHITVLNSGKK
jgi:hypothetical protein